MATLHVTGLAKAYGATPIFEGVSFRLPPRERLALIGRNGAGKTTLLRTLAGELEPDAGEIGRPRSYRVALHDQRPPLARDVSLGGYIGEGVADVREAEARLAELEARMAGGDGSAETLAAYDTAQRALEAAGGYSWRSRLESILRGLGFDARDADRPLRSFSGGELTRASLARALASNPDLLLLDEPTNHLDLASLEWLEDELTGLDCSILLVSHDRWFLERVATGVLEIERGRAQALRDALLAPTGARRPRRSRTRPRRSSASRPRSRACSASWTSSARARALARRRRASRRSSASSASTSRAATRRWRSASRAPSAAGGSCVEADHLDAAPRREARCSRTPASPSSAASASR